MLRTAVIGVGYLGRFHAQKYAQLANSELVGVVDSDYTRATVVAKETGTRAFKNHEDLLGKVDAVSIVVPTVHHHQITRPLLEAGIHVLLEKPIASTLAEAEDLEKLASQQQLVLQIGHVQRYNVVFKEFRESIQQPKFIENLRIAPFPKRGTDVDVILDLMIHDIDLVLAVTGELPIKVDCTGVSILTPLTDLAHARLVFPDGCVASLTASRVSDKAERKMRIFQNGLYLSLDFGTGQARKLQVNFLSELSPEDLQPETLQLERGDDLLAEIADFLECIEQDNSPQVSAKDGRRALQVAWQLKDLLVTN
ncbi:MAG TPA: oxidoreductase [Deltaproteobacteria bacterium]|nr:oxidoreductase [Deltaproteobacteria bacterium]